MNTRPIFNWLAGLLHDALEGAIHATVVAAGLTAAGDAVTNQISLRVLGAAALIGAGKQALLYLNANPIPALFGTNPAAEPTTTNPPKQ